MYYSINKEWFKPIIIFIIFLFIIPDDILELTSFFKATSPSFIDYKWIDGFFYSYIFLPIIPFGIINLLHSKNKIIINVSLFYLLIIIYNVIKILIGDNRIIVYSSYEYFYTILISILLFSILDKNFYSLDLQKKFFEFFIVLHILGLFVSISTSLGSFSNRYHSQNLDVESTSYIIGAYIIYLWDVKKNKNILIHLGLFLLLFYTGSRIAMAFLIPFYLLKFIFGFLNLIKSGKIYLSRTKLFLLAISSLLLLGLLYTNLNLILDKIDVSRFTNINFNLNQLDISNIKDSSLYGRFQSIVVGIQILGDNIFGLPFAFIPLQIECVRGGYPTFPHSTLLLLLIIIGPLFWFVLYKLFKYLFNLMRNSSKYFHVILYLTVLNLVSGGALLNYKMYFFYFLIFNISYLDSKLNSNENNLLST